MTGLFSKKTLIPIFILLGIAVFLMPLSAAHAQGALMETVNVLTKISNVAYGGFAMALHNAVVPALSWVLSIVGSAVDIAIAFSMNDLGQGDGPGLLDDPSISIAWKVIRDVCNIAFIFALVTIAIRTILGLANYNAKKALSTVIIAAVLINFSLYFAKVVIDVSNIASVWLYQGIVDLVPPNAAGEKNLSTALAASFRMHKLYAAKEIGDTNAFAAGIAIIALQIFAIKIFIEIAYLFIARGVAFVIYMILSPIAVIGFIIPRLAEQGKRIWQGLINQALLAPMFLIMLLIVLYFINSFGGITLDAKPDPFTKTSFNYTDYVMFFVIYLLLKQCLEVAKHYSGEMGDILSGALKSGLGIALGGFAAAGGAIGRNFVGRAMVGKMEDKAFVGGLKDKIAAGGMGGFAARLQLGATEKMSKSSFDARATKVYGGLTKTAGLNSKAEFGGISIDASKVGDTEKKGYRGTYDAAKKFEEERAEGLGKGKEGEIRRMAYAKSLEENKWYKLKAEYAKEFFGSKVSTRDAILSVAKDLAENAPAGALKADKEDAKKKSAKIQGHVTMQASIKDYLEKAQKTGNVEEQKKAALVAEATMKRLAETMEKESEDDKLRFARGHEDHAGSLELDELNSKISELTSKISAQETALAAARQSEKQAKENGDEGVFRDEKKRANGIESELRSFKEELAKNQEMIRLVNEGMGEISAEDKEKASKKFGKIDKDVWKKSLASYADYTANWKKTFELANSKLMEIQKMLDADRIAQSMKEVTGFIEKDIIGGDPTSIMKNNKKKFVLDPENKVKGGWGLKKKAAQAKEDSNQKLFDSETAGERGGGGEEKESGEEKK